jgi:hypothetical protein
MPRCSRARTARFDHRAPVRRAERDRCSRPEPGFFPAPGPTGRASGPSRRLRRSRDRIYLADTITQQLHDLGFETVQSDEAGPEPGGRALIISGVFRINEGHRRHLVANDASVAVAVEIKVQSYGANPQRLIVIQLDSRRIPNQSWRHREPEVSSATMRLAVTIANTVAEPAAANGQGMSDIHGMEHETPPRQTGTAAVSADH